jgi:hypothetical protein
MMMIATHTRTRRHFYPKAQLVASIFLCVSFVILSCNECKVDANMGNSAAMIFPGGGGKFWRIRRRGMRTSYYPSSSKSSRSLLTSSRGGSTSVEATDIYGEK